jgi:hypothetical protein
MKEGERLVYRTQLQEAEGRVYFKTTMISYTIVEIYKKFTFIVVPSPDTCSGQHPGGAQL